MNDFIEWMEELNLWIPIMAFLLWKVYACRRCKSKDKLL